MRAGKHQNPVDALFAAEAALAQTEAKILELGQQRTAKLLDTDGTDEVAAIDRLIDQHQGAAGIYRDRMTALRDEVKRARAQAAAAAMAARVAATEKALAERDAIAAKLESAIRDMGRLYFDLIDANLGLAKLWGFSNSARRAGFLGESIIARECGHAMFAAGRPRHGISRFPSPTNAGLGITGDTSGGTLAQRIAGASAALLDMIRAVPNRQPEDEAA
jgi:hypothetical protein